MALAGMYGSLEVAMRTIGAHGSVARVGRYAEKAAFEQGNDGVSREEEGRVRHE